MIHSILRLTFTVATLLSIAASLGTQGMPGEKLDRRLRPIGVSDEVNPVIEAIQ
jgi:hypothetical protein